ncbi:AraC family transcriptional regulator [Paraburkholderia lacunae]|uniref:AraC family transcriptional regulator n=2 Tax=Paraburkholderia lacunae TaxID=2211104 RepID=A0A370N5I8_9BURK|nr:AraC family transcriptional regulator [Paraburkholderia lacunae]
MECFADVHGDNAAGSKILLNPRPAGHIGIVLFGGFALPEAATIVEVFQSANALAETVQPGGTRYNVDLLSVPGGKIASSSSVFVWTERIEAFRQTDSFRALFVVGGTQMQDALRDERLTTWLRDAYRRGELVFPTGEGRPVLEAAGFGQTISGQHYGERETTWNSPRVDALAAPVSPLQTALKVVQADLGAAIAGQIADWVAPPAETQFTAILRKSTSGCVSEPIQTAARWLAANGNRPIVIDDAAQAAVMSERNFLRRFKIEMGVTPSDFLLYVRLNMSCRLLIETNLPVDKIARRCGIGSGGRLSKLFRKHLGTTPTEYRSSKRHSSVSA